MSRLIDLSADIGEIFGAYTLLPAAIPSVEDI